MNKMKDFFSNKLLSLSFDIQLLIVRGTEVSLGWPELEPSREVPHLVVHLEAKSGGYFLASGPQS